MATRKDLLREKAQALEKLEKVRQRRKFEGSLKEFIIEAWPILEPGRKLYWNWHLDVICAYMEAFYRRDIKRLIITIPPRCMKSLIVSVFYPAWVWAKDPPHQFLTLSHAGDLATRDSVKARNLITSDWYQYYWGYKVIISSDQNEKRQYNNSAGGHRNAQGLSAGLTGKGGDTILIDDPHDAEKAQSDVERQNTLDIYDGKVTTRLNNQVDGGICLIMQRLHTADLAGHILKKEKQGWIHLCIPMEYDGRRYDSVVGKKFNDPRKKKNEILWKDRFPRYVVDSLKEDLGTYGTAGQLQQRPNPAGGGILKKHWWRQWPSNKPLPVCVHVFQSYDTAYSKDALKTNSHSARTTWGIFLHEQEGRYCIFLMEGWNDQAEYPELRRESKKSYNDYQPHCVLIEKKASGQSLIQDLRRSGVPVSTYNPDKDKIARAYSVQAMLESGTVYYPDRKWAHNIIEHVATFPNGEPPSGDYTDTITQALIYLRNGHWVKHPDDDEDLKESRREHKQAAYG